MAEDSDDLQVNLTGTVPSADTSGAVVLIQAETLDAIRRHAQEDLDHELGGVLVGTAADGEAGTVVYVEGAIRAEHAQSDRGSITFTHETWDYVNQAKDRDFPGKRTIGWYHTHPGFGVFLSEYDLFIHRNFFNLPWQVALVVDPRADTSGVFVWRKGEIRGPAEPEVVHKAPQGSTPPPFTASRPKAAAPGPAWQVSVLLGIGLLLLMQAVHQLKPPPAVPDPRTLAAVESLSRQVQSLQDEFAAASRAQTAESGEAPDGYVVQPGDTLRSIAQRFYGDPEKWGAIAVANGLPPGEPQPGVSLLIPLPPGKPRGRAAGVVVE